MLHAAKGICNLFENALSGADLAVKKNLDERSLSNIDLLLRLQAAQDHLMITCTSETF